MSGSTNTTADEVAIHALMARYADAVNRTDADAWAAVWTADGVWEVFGATPEGRDASVALWKSAMKGFRFVFHLIHSGVVEVDGDTATGRWSVSEQLQTVNGEPAMLLALYHDHYRREDGEWRFARRRLEVRYHGPPDLSADPAPRVG